MRENTLFSQATAYQIVQRAPLIEPKEDGTLGIHEQTGDVPGLFYEEDGRVTLRVRADSAHSVELECAGKRYMLQKDKAGFWSGTFLLDRGFQYVDLFHDGMPVLSPVMPIGFGCSRPMNFIEVPCEGDDFYQLKVVPHGTVARHYYTSSVTGDTQSCLVYCPPKSEGKALPTLYLQHGLGENETGWIYQGHVNFIMDNLLAEGKVKPMRIVMCSGMAQLDGHVDTTLFPEILVKDVIPYIERTYSVFSDKWNRAVAGLSMGSMHASIASLSHPELFGYVGLFSGFMRMIWTKDQPHLAVLDNAQAFMQNYSVFFRAMGKQDVFFPIFEEDDAILAQKGVATERRLYEGAHEWQVWRMCVRDFLPMLF